MSNNDLFVVCMITLFEFCSNRNQLLHFLDDIIFGGKYYTERLVFVSILKTVSRHTETE